MCLVATDVVFGETVPAVALLFGAHAFKTTQPARDFLSLLLLRRHRRRLSVRPDPPSRSRKPATIVDLPTELIQQIRSELLSSTAEAARAEWESTFLQRHEACRHADCRIDPALFGSASREAAMITQGQSKDDGWWNGCFWCDKARSDELWDLAAVDPYGLLQTAREYLAIHSLSLVSDHPLDYLAAPLAQEPVFVISSSSRRPPTAQIVGQKLCLRLTDAIDPTDPSMPSPSQVPFTVEQVLAADLDSCSADDDEGDVGFVEDVFDPSTRPESCPQEERRTARRLDRVYKECRIGRSAGSRGPRWLRVVDVSCECP